MKCRTWFLGAALLAAVAIAPVPAADAPAAAPKADEPAKAESPAAPKTEAPAAPAPAAPAKPALDGDLAILVRECKLTDEQVTKLAEAAAVIATQLADWQKANADKLAALQKEFQAAQASKDEAALSKARTDAIPVFQERISIIVKGQKGMMDILTPEQRAIWLGFITFRQLMIPMVQIDLTAEQLGKIREICNTAGKDFDAVKEQGEAGAAALLKVRNAMLSNVRDNVLTDAQRAKWPQQLNENPPAPPAGAAPPAAEPKAAPKDSKAPDAKAPEDKAPTPEPETPAK
jgi:hypothetical protein